jgi:hypothetical protein
MRVVGLVERFLPERMWMLKPVPQTGAMGDRSGTFWSFWKLMRALWNSTRKLWAGRGSLWLDLIV